MSSRCLSRVAMLACVVATSFLSPADARQWTDKWGRKFEAKVLKVDATTVTFEVNGSQRPIPLKNLSDQDVAYLRQLSGSGGRVRGPIRGNSGSSTNSGSAGNATEVRLKGSFKSKAVELTPDLNIPVRLVQSDPASRRWVYRTAHFEFISDSLLTIDRVRDFSWIFEATHDYVGTLPVQIPRSRDGGRLMRTYLFETTAAYVRAGGAPGSLGAYVPARDAILVPVGSLETTRVENGVVSLENRLANRVLQHEITHYLMRGETQRAAWFIEGLAEYVACVPFHQNRLLLTHHPKSVVDCVTATGWDGIGGYRLGRVIAMPPLEQFMQGSYQQFQATRNAYPISLLLVYFFACFDGDKDGAGLRRYAEMLLEGRTEPDARATLLAGRSFAQLESDFAKAWNQRGIRVTFAK